MRYQEILGSARHIRRLTEIIEDPDKADEEFVIVPPGEHRRLKSFLGLFGDRIRKIEKEMGSC
jgi:hypothetical protein